jgi:hypothetical protein
MMSNTQNEYGVSTSDVFQAYLATVTKVYTNEESFSDKPLNNDSDTIKIYNNN